MARAQTKKATATPDLELWAVEDLRRYEKNAKIHPPEQVAAIRGSVERFGWTIPILIEEDGLMVAGHGRLDAAEAIYAEGGLIRLPDGRELPPGTVPVMIARGWSEEQRRAYTLADNRLTEGGSWDRDLLRLELSELDFEDDDLLARDIGFTDDDLAAFLSEEEPTIEPGRGLSENYSRKIKAPIYEVTGDRPEVTALFNREKADKLIDAIDAADVPEDVASFLRMAAERHTVFNFRNIAEFYAHADAETQELMEQSALVIVDFNRAIEDGFVRLAEGMMEQADGSKARNYAE